MVVLQRAVKCSWHTWAQHSVFFLFLHSLNNCTELHAIRNALCNSQDILLFFLLLLPLPFGQWFVVRLQSCFWFPSLLIAPLVFLNCSPCPTFLFEDMCPVCKGESTGKWEECFLTALLRFLVHLSILMVWMLVISNVVSKLVYLSLQTAEVYHYG